MTDQVKHFYSVTLNDIADLKASNWLSLDH